MGKEESSNSPEWMAEPGDKKVSDTWKFRLMLFVLGSIESVALTPGGVEW